MNSKAKLIFRKDYQKPKFLIPRADLKFILDDTKTVVSSKLKVIYNDNDFSKKNTFSLHGENLTLKKIKINGSPLNEKEYIIEENQLKIFNVPQNFSLEIENEINPKENLALEGLYKSGNIFCTQNEPLGFRRITYFIDRPDNMCLFKTKIIGDKIKYPVMLSNGNPVGKGEMENNLHWIEWEDPFPKPSYLFALVAGDLDLLQDNFITKSGRTIDLRIYSDKGNKEKCHHAMSSLKKAMKWDEERFSLEYDLDIYMIVAVDAFNMGAMENKGLNIFNSHYVLADDKSATDTNFIGIEGVIAHEYFHNWTGNRVTLRDWFQLTLKEGLTVFRDQEFTSDMQSRPVKRIEDVNALRTLQFAEDSGPNSHAIRPESYMEINNFYTLTVYEKGAEVIRMLHTILGEKGFQAGMKKYFKLFDGKAVTCDDFLYSMETANSTDLTEFKKWYVQNRTPEVELKYSYNQTEKTFEISYRQNLPKNENNPENLFIPLSIGLIDKSGKDIALDDKGNKTTVKYLEKKEGTLTFKNIPEKPLPSINRNFSAPIIIKTNETIDDLLFQFTYDSDDFSRWNAGQSVLKFYIKQMLDENELKVNGKLLDAYKNILMDNSIDNHFKALLLTLPSEHLLIQDYQPIDFDGIHEIKNLLKKEIAYNLKDELLQLLDSLKLDKKYTFEKIATGKRALRLQIFDYLSYLDEAPIKNLLINFYKNANNMTDEIGSLQILAYRRIDGYEEQINSFYEKWKDNQLVLNKWFSLFGSMDSEQALQKIKEMEKHEKFNIKNPNMLRALFGPFFGNLPYFHNIDGSGYKFLSDKILEIDPFNPSMSSALAKGFKLYQKLDEKRKSLMQAELNRILENKNLSKNTYEIIFNTVK